MNVRRTLLTTVTLASMVVLSACAATKYDTKIDEADARGSINSIAVVGFTVVGKSLFSGPQKLVEAELKGFVSALQESDKFEKVMTPGEVAMTETYQSLEVGPAETYATTVTDLDKYVQADDERDWAAIAEGMDVDALLIFTNKAGEVGRGVFGQVAMQFEDIHLSVYAKNGEAIYYTKGRQLAKTHSWWSWILGSVPFSAKETMAEEAGAAVAEKMLSEW